MSCVQIALGRGSQEFLVYKDFLMLAGISCSQEFLLLLGFDPH